MAIHAVPTISEEIYLQDLSKVVKELEGKDCPKKEQAWVKVRQATESDQLQISQRYAESEVMWLVDGSAMEKRNRNALADRMFRAYLVLIDAGNILDKSGEPVFEFTDSSDYPKFKGSYSKFQDKWGSLPSSVTEAIERATFTLNPHWNPLRAFEDEDLGE